MKAQANNDEIVKEIKATFGQNTQVSVSGFRGGWSVKMSNPDKGLSGGGGFAGDQSAKEITDQLAKTYWPWQWNQ